MAIAKSLTELIGNTPLLELGKFSKEKGLETPVIAKVEYFNLAGQRMDQPSTGVTLVVTTYTDGSRTTSKVFD